MHIVTNVGLSNYQLLPTEPGSDAVVKQPLLAIVDVSEADHTELCSGFRALLNISLEMGNLD